MSMPAESWRIDSLLSAVFRGLPGLHLLLSPTFHVVAASDSFIRASGSAPEQIIGHSVLELFASNGNNGSHDSGTKLSASLERVLQTGTMPPQKLVFPFAGAGGTADEERYYKVVHSPVLDHDGTISHILHTLEDVTELAQLTRRQKAAEQTSRDLQTQIERTAGEMSAKAGALQHSQDRFRELLDAAPDAIMEIDPDGKVVLVNNAAASLFQFSPEELIGREVETFVIPESSRCPHRKHRAGYAANPHIRRMSTGLELSAQKKDGTIIPVEISLSPLWSEGKLNVIAIVHDISERKQFEEKLQQAKKLEALGRMAGGTAHEFNNLLTVIMGYSALMLSSIDSQTKTIEYVECIRNASARAGRLTHQLLAFGRKQLLSPQVLELNSLLADMSRLIAEITKEGVECQIVASPDPAWICVDPVQMEQVIGNLLTNARNAMPRGGKITITVRMVEFSRHDVRPYPSLAAGQYAELSVSDTGIGMSGEVQARIFEPFFSTKGRAEATGMGLATAYGIITQSGGTMSVQSELGSGTTLRIYLPQPAESDIAAARTRSSYSDWLQGSETILLVEDQPQLLSITSEFLRNSGYTIIAAANADQALLSSDGFSGKIDLLITDIVMPGMDGHKLAIRLKALRPGIPVLYVSGYIDEAFVELPLTTDEAFMLKPFTLEALGLKIREMLQRGKTGLGRRRMQ